MRVNGLAMVVGEPELKDNIAYVPVMLETLHVDAIVQASKEDLVMDLSPGEVIQVRGVYKHNVVYILRGDYFRVDSRISECAEALFA